MNFRPFYLLPLKKKNPTDSFFCERGNREKGLIADADQELLQTVRMETNRMSLGCGKPAEGPVQMAPNKHKEGKVAWQQENKNSKRVKHLFIFIKVAIFLNKKKLYHVLVAGMCRKRYTHPELVEM